MSDTAMVGAASLFTATVAVSTAVSLRHPECPNEPFGLRFPGPASAYLAVGLGSGVAAPWPMPVIALVAALRAEPGSDRAAKTCAAVGATVLATSVIEPTSWGLRTSSPVVRATFVLHLLSGAALFLAGTRRLRPQGGS